MALSSADSSVFVLIDSVGEERAAMVLQARLSDFKDDPQVSYLNRFGFIARSTREGLLAWVSF